MRLGVHFGPFYASTSGRRVYRTRSQRATAAKLTAVVVAGWLVWHNPWVGVPVALFVALVIVASWRQGHPRPRSQVQRPADRPVHGGGSAGREQQVKSR